MALLYITIMWKYYRDVTLYALAICSFIGLASSGAYNSITKGLFNTILIFGLFGSGLGVLAFNYFQKNQYYLYHNLGFTKYELVTKTWVINFFISIITAIFLGFLL